MINKKERLTPFIKQTPKRHIFFIQPTHQRHVFYLNFIYKPLIFKI